MPVLLARDARFTDGIRSRIGLELHTSHQVPIPELLHISMVEMGESSMPESGIHVTCGSKSSKLLHGNHMAIKNCCVGRRANHRGSEEESIIKSEGDASQRNSDKEVFEPSQIEN